jgi:hypothetical protein
MKNQNELSKVAKMKTIFSNLLHAPLLTYITRAVVTVVQRPQEKQ